jgi:LysR family transcriptional regulator, transcriptional activator of the cysJI operon
MNLNQLKIFYSAVKAGNLSVAAEDLFITQPAVTKGIQRLQEYYELKFIDYVGKKLVLTDAGEALFKIAEKIFDMETHAEESIRDFQQRKRGRIRILSSESFGDYYLPEVIIPFCKTYPLVQVSMNILPTDLVVENTASLKCDVGFISYPVDHEKLVVKEVLEDELVIITPRLHPLAGRHMLRPRDLGDQVVIMHEEGSAPRRAIEDFIQRNHINVKIPMELSSNRAIKRAVEHGLGIALISRKVAKEEIEQRRLVALSLADSAMKRKFFLIHHKDKYISESLQRLMEMVFKWAAEIH